MSLKFEKRYTMLSRKIKRIFHNLMIDTEFKTSRIKRKSQKPSKRKTHKPNELQDNENPLDGRSLISNSSCIKRIEQILHIYKGENV